MNGIYFDFDTNDLVINSDGSFNESDISSQNCALVASSQICKLTAPEIGTQLLVKLLNRKSTSISKAVRDAEKAVRLDGGTNVSITVEDDGHLTFKAVYES